MSSDLQSRILRLEPGDDCIVAEARDLPRMRRALLINVVDRDQLVAEQERSPGPDEDVTDPATVAVAPLRPKALHLATARADRAAEGSRAAHDPAFARK